MCFYWVGGSHWLMVYGDAHRFKGAFLSLLVHRWMGFCLRPNPEFAKLGVFRKIRPKKPPFVLNWVFFAAIWYSDGSQYHTFWGIEMVEILKSTLSLPVQNFLKTPQSFYQGCSQPHSPRWARVPLCSFFLKSRSKCFLFFLTLCSFSSSFWPSGWATPGRPWLRYWFLHSKLIDIDP